MREEHPDRAFERHMSAMDEQRERDQLCELVARHAPATAPASRRVADLRIIDELLTNLAKELSPFAPGRRRQAGEEG